jgi:hypothetical protein
MFHFQAVSAETELPAILDYYPNCDYQVMKVQSIKIKTEDPSADQTKLSLLNKLRRKGRDIGADAIIVTEKFVKKLMNIEKYVFTHSTDISKYALSFKAELIKLCESTDKRDQKRTPFNHEGNSVKTTLLSTTTIRTNIVLNPLEKAELNHPIIKNKELSLVNGIYGVKVGASYEEVISTLGDPSIVLSEFEDEAILGYGRKLWFFFQVNKLVKIDTQLDSVSPTLLNKIPLRNYFDDSPWMVDNKLARQSTLAEVKSTLGIKTQLNYNNQLIQTDKGNQLVLSFSFRKDIDNNTKEYFLDSFTLQTKGYRQPSHQISYNRELQFDDLSLAFVELTEGKEVSWNGLKAKLGQPLGRITLTATSFVDIYNANLLIAIKSGELDNILLLEPLFNLPKRQMKDAWYLGEYVEGKSIEQLKKLFPADPFELDDKIIIGAEQYQLTLFFEDNEDKAALYEAELSF